MCKELKYKMVVTDYDGTFVRSNGVLSDFTKQTVRRYVELGGKFVICTGRETFSINADLKQQNFNNCIVASYQGAVINDEHGGLLLNESIDNDTAKVICDYLEEHNINYCVMTSEKYFAKRKDEYVIAYQDVCHTTAVEVGEKSLYDYIIENNYLFNKILLLMDKTEKQKYFNLLFDKFSSLACVSYSAYPLVEITPFKCSKGGAIDFLSKYYHIEKDEIIAVGDSLNDATMAEYAGLTFAVKNADKEFKDLVEIFDCTNDDDAVANIIEKYTL